MQIQITQGTQSQILNNANPNPPTLDVGLNSKSQTMQIQITQLWMWV